MKQIKMSQNEVSKAFLKILASFIHCTVLNSGKWQQRNRKNLNELFVSCVLLGLFVDLAEDKKWKENEFKAWRRWLIEGTLLPNKDSFWRLNDAKLFFDPKRLPNFSDMQLQIW